VGRLVLSPSMHVKSCSTYTELHCCIPGCRGLQQL
jgi:hypothetical protein